MLLPALSQARARARAAVCMSNQKQLWLGVRMYLNDYDDWLPRAEIWINKTLVGGYLSKSTGKHDAWYCPSDIAGSELPAASRWLWTASYAVNADVVGDNWRNRNSNMRWIRYPKYKVMFIEQIPVPAAGYTSHWTVGYTSWGRRDLRHYDGHNICFCDGVVRRYRNPFETVGGGSVWLSTPGDWRYGCSEPTDQMLTAYCFSLPRYPNGYWIWPKYLHEDRNTQPDACSWCPVGPQ